MEHNPLIFDFEPLGKLTSVTRAQEIKDNIKRTHFYQNEITSIIAAKIIYHTIGCETIRIYGKTKLQFEISSIYKLAILCITKEKKTYSLVHLKKIMASFFVRKNSFSSFHSFLSIKQPNVPAYNLNDRQSILSNSSHFHLILTTFCRKSRKIRSKAKQLSMRYIFAIK